MDLNSINNIIYNRFSVSIWKTAAINVAKFDVDFTVSLENYPGQK